MIECASVFLLTVLHCTHFAHKKPSFYSTESKMAMRMKVRKKERKKESSWIFLEEKERKKERKSRSISLFTVYICMYCV